MKRSIILIIFLVIFFITIGAGNSKTKWEYATVVLLPNNGTVIFKSPTESFEASSFIGIDPKIKYKGKPTYPPEYPLFEYLGNQGWELIGISGKEDSMSGDFVCWFKRPK